MVKDNRGHTVLAVCMTLLCCVLKLKPKLSSRITHVNALKSDAFDQALSRMMLKETRYQVRMNFVYVDVFYCQENAVICTNINLTRSALVWNPDKYNIWLDHLRIL